MCSVCRKPIDREQLEAEVEDHGQSFHFHVQCMEAWKSVVALGNDTGPAPTLQPAADGGYSAAGELLSETGPER